MIGGKPWGVDITEEGYMVLLCIGLGIGRGRAIGNGERGAGEKKL